MDVMRMMLKHNVLIVSIVTVIVALMGLAYVNRIKFIDKIKRINRYFALIFVSIFALLLLYYCFSHDFFIVKNENSDSYAINSDGVHFNDNLKNANAIYTGSFEHVYTVLPPINQNSIKTDKIKQYYDNGIKCGIREHYDRALTYYKDALDLLDAQQEPNFYAHILMHIATVNSFLGHFEESKKCYENALKIVKRTGYRCGEAAAYQGLSKLDSYLGNFDRALAYLEQARIIHKSLQNIVMLADVSRLMGDIKHQMGYFKEALHLYEYARDIYVGFNDLYGEAKVMHQLGDIDVNFGNKRKGRQHYMRSLAIFKQIGSIEGEAKVLLALGRIENDMNHFDQSSLIFQQARVLFSKIKNARGTGKLLLGEAFLNINLGNVDKARALFLEAIANFQRINSKYAEGKTHFYLANFEAFLGNAERAHIHYEKCLDLIQHISCPFMLSQVYREMANLKREIGENKDARDLYAQSVLYAKKTDDPTLLSHAYAGLATAEIYTNSYDSAGIHFQEALTLVGENNLLKGDILFGLGHTKHLLGENEEALKYLFRALKEYESVGNIYGKAKFFYIKALIDFHRDNYDEAYSNINIALSLFKQCHHTIYVAKCYYERGRIHFIRGKNDLARADCQESFQQASEAHQPWVKACILNLQGHICLYEGDTKAALHYCTESYMLFANLVERTEEISALNNVGLIYLYTGAFKQSEQAFDKAFELCKHISFPYGLCRTYINMGMLHLKLAHFKTSLDFFTKALHIAQKIESKGMEAEARLGLGMLKEINAESKEARALLQLAFNQAKESGEYVLEGRILNQLALNLIHVGSFVQAQRSAEQAMHLFETCKCVFELSVTKRLLSKIQWRNRQYLDALTLTQQALQIAQKCNNPSEMAKNYIDLGYNFLKHEKMKDALTYFKLGFDLAADVNDQLYSADALKAQALYYTSQNQYALAHQHYQKAFKIYEHVVYPSKIINTKRKHARVFVKEGQFTKAQQKLEQCYAEAPQINSHLTALIGYDLGSLFIKNANFQRASYYLRRSYLAFKDLHSNDKHQYYAAYLKYLFVKSLTHDANAKKELMLLMTELAAPIYQREKADLLHYMAIIESIDAQFDKANDYFSSCIEAYESLNIKMPLCACYVSMMYHFDRVNMPDKIKECQLKALHLTRMRADLYHEALILMAYSNLLKQKQQVQSNEYAMKARHLCEKLNIREQHTQSLYALL